MQRYIPLLCQIFLFGVVGLTTLLIDISITYMCYHYLDLPAYLSSAVGFLSGFVFNFPMNRKKVFKHSRNDFFSLRAQITGYVLLCIFNLISTSLMVSFLVSNDMLIQYAKVLVTAIIAVWNFVIFKYLIFTKKLPT